MALFAWETLRQAAHLTQSANHRKLEQAAAHLPQQKTAKRARATFPARVARGVNKLAPFRPNAPARTTRGSASAAERRLCLRPQRFQYVVTFAQTAGEHHAVFMMSDVMEVDRGMVRLLEPEVGSEPSAPFHTIRRLLLMCILFNHALQLGSENELDEEWQSVEEMLRAGDAQPDQAT
jgi:hypothetical protein